MSSEQSEILGKFIFVTLIIALFADTFLRFFWNKAYYTFGIPIFVMRVPVGNKYKGVPHQYLLEEEFQFGLFTPAFTFKSNDSRSIFFREEFFGTPIRLRYWAVMHGLIIFEHDKKQVTVKGIANWFTLWLTISLILELLKISNFFELHVTGTLFFIILFFGVFYPLQSYRFSKVCKFAAELCSNKVFLNSGGV
jgi:hypothetical protein